MAATADWSFSDDEQAAAYHRAGLPHWAEECLSEAGLPTEPPSHCPPLPLRPAAVAQATVSSVAMTLPYDQDFGRAERFVELWAKAFRQVLFCRKPFSAELCACCNVRLIWGLMYWLLAPQGKGSVPHSARP